MEKPFTDYSIFNENDLRMSDEDRIKAVCKSKAGLVDSNKELWTVVGEWTPANTGKHVSVIADEGIADIVTHLDCAAKLNGTRSSRLLFPTTLDDLS